MFCFDQMGSAKLVESNSVMFSPAESARPGRDCRNLAPGLSTYHILNKLNASKLSGSHCACPWCRGDGRGPDGSWEEG